MSLSPEQLSANCPELSTLPEIYHKLNDAINSPNCTTGIISRIISQDPILTMKVLRMVNSAFYGFPQEIEDIPQAILIIGLQQLNDLVLANTVISLFDGYKLELFSMEDFWKFSIAGGLSSRIIGNLSTQTFSERLFVGGLLHNIGRLIMAISKPDLLIEAHELSIKEEILLHEAEKRVFGFNNEEMNYHLMNEWSLPHSIIDISSHYLTPDNSTENKNEATIVGIANSLTQSLSLGYTGDYYINPIDERNWGELGLNINSIEEAATRLNEQFKDVLNSII
ncbi:MAG: HDOD domain-containing protein [Lentisphaeraceae bacterium]|nr:HDOD domain-containing protein [Lentisphaeraceae bacterium]